MRYEPPGRSMYTIRAGQNERDLAECYGPEEREPHWQAYQERGWLPMFLGVSNGQVLQVPRE